MANLDFTPKPESLSSQQIRTASRIFAKLSNDMFLLTVALRANPHITEEMVARFNAALDTMSASIHSTAVDLAKKVHELKTLLEVSSDVPTGAEAPTTSEGDEAHDTPTP